MSAHNKKFVVVSVFVLFVIIGGWFFILASAQADIEENKNQCKSLQKKINFLLQNEYPPKENILTIVKNENEWLKENVASLKSSMNFDMDTSSLSLSPTDFRSSLEQKISTIQNKTNKLAIKFDNKLGFSKSIPSISPKHYIHLELAYNLTTKLIDLVDEDSQSIQNFTINHVALDNKEDTNYSINISFQARLYVVMQFLHSISQPKTKNEDVFFHISKVVLKKSDKDLIDANISLSALTLDLSSMQQNTSTPKETTKDNNDPLWKY